MRSRLGTVAVVAAMSSSAACGAESTPDQPSPASSTTIEVSDETTCRQLFNNDEPFQTAARYVVTFAQSESITPGVDLSSDDLVEVSQTLERIAERASDRLRPSIALVSERLVTIADYLDAGGGKAVDIDDFQAAGYEINSICEKYPAAIAGT